MTCAQEARRLARKFRTGPYPVPAAEAEALAWSIVWGLWVRGQSRLGER